MSASLEKTGWGGSTWRTSRSRGASPLMRGMLTIAAFSAVAVASAEAADLLFRVSADAALLADQATGDPTPNFQSHVAIVPTGRSGGAIATWL
jgi:hypothetical protein